MATQSPFSMLESILQSFNLPVTPPAWAIDETHRRIVLLLNHVLMQEPQAMERLVRQKGRIVLMQWRAFTFRLLVTPAGLFDVAAPDAQTDLLLVITQESPLSIAQELMQGGKPSVRIEGDVQLAAEVSWLIDHVRWDIEEDLARILGDAPAHAVVQLARTVAQAVQQFVGQRGRDGAGGSSA
jgi:ubiquinone biosynthesis protein UbiJ